MLLEPYYADDWLTVYLGDCRVVLAELPADSVHCVITSPPYYGLRDYGTAEWEGGDEGCDHAGPPSSRADRPGNGLDGGKATVDAGTVRRGDCRCGARRIDSQIGLEPTPEQYVTELAAVFREVRRVLRPDGTVWLNLGDSYAGGNQTGRNDNGRPEKGRGWAEYDIKRTKIERRDGLKPKDRMMIPARVALALQADGWWLRDEIVWAKPNPMPSSVTDRTTPAHEMVYLLTKRARYWYDADAVREPVTDSTIERAAYGFREYNWKDADGRPSETVARRAIGLRADAASVSVAKSVETGRNKRSVWTIATQPYPEAHFATFPEALVEPMVLAGCPEGGTVLDPFAGSGTVGLVAQRHSRRAILIDLSAEYMRQLLVRNAAIPLGLQAS